MRTIDEDIKAYWVQIESVLSDPNSTDKDVKAMRKLSLHVSRLEHAAKIARMMEG